MRVRRRSPRLRRSRAARARRATRAAPRSSARLPIAADFLVVTEGEHHRALRREARREQRLDRFADRDQRTLVVDRAAAPDEAIVRCDLRRAGSSSARDCRRAPRPGARAGGSAAASGDVPLPGVEQAHRDVFERERLVQPRIRRRPGIAGTRRRPRATSSRDPGTRSSGSGSPPRGVARRGRRRRAVPAQAPPGSAATAAAARKASAPRRRRRARRRGIQRAFAWRERVAEALESGGARENPDVPHRPLRELRSRLRRRLQERRLVARRALLHRGRRLRVGDLPPPFGGRKEGRARSSPTSSACSTASTAASRRAPSRSSTARATTATRCGCAAAASTPPPACPISRFELEEIATFRGDRICRLEDRYDDATAKAIVEYANTHGATLGLASS